MSDHDTSFGYPPGFEIGYDEVTSPVNILSTNSGSPTTMITCAAHAFDGAPVLLTWYTPRINADTGGVGDYVGVTLWEGGTQITTIANIRTAQILVGDYHTTMTAYRFTPTAGSHTYLIKAYASSTTGTPSMGAGSGTGGADSPAFVRITKV